MTVVSGLEHVHIFLMGLARQKLRETKVHTRGCRSFSLAHEWQLQLPDITGLGILEKPVRPCQCVSKEVDCFDWKRRVLLNYVRTAHSFS